VRLLSTPIAAAWQLFLLATILGMRSWTGRTSSFACLVNVPAERIETLAYS